MPKSYEWLALYFMRPHKNLGHFIKCFGIFTRAKQKKQKKIKKKRKAETYLTPRGEAHLPWPAQPPPGALSSSSPPSQAARCRQSMAAAPPRRREASSPPWT